MRRVLSCRIAFVLRKPVTRYFKSNSSISLSRVTLASTEAALIRDATVPTHNCLRRKLPGRQFITIYQHVIRAANDSTARCIAKSEALRIFKRSISSTLARDRPGHCRCLDLSSKRSRLRSVNFLESFNPRESMAPKSLPLPQRRRQADRGLPRRNRLFGQVPLLLHIYSFSRHDPLKAPQSHPQIASQNRYQYDYSTQQNAGAAYHRQCQTTQEPIGISYRLLPRLAGTQVQQTRLQ